MGKIGRHDERVSVGRASGLLREAGTLHELEAAVWWPRDTVRGRVGRPAEGAETSNSVSPVLLQPDIVFPQAKVNENWKSSPAICVLVRSSDYITLARNLLIN